MRCRLALALHSKQTPSASRAGRPAVKLIPMSLCILLCLPWRLLGQTLQLSPPALAHFKAGETAQKEKNYARAKSEYKLTIASSPRFAPAYLNLGLIYQQQKRPSAASGMFQRAVQLDPHLTGAQFFLGVDYCLEGEPRLALPHLEAALHQKPDLADGYTWLATAQKMNGQLDAEVSTLDLGLRRYPSNIDMLYLLGRAYEMRGRRAMDRLKKSDPQSSYVEQWLGENYAHEGFPLAGLVQLQKAVATSPQRPGLHTEIGEIFLETGNLDSALKEFNLELKFRPRSIRALARRGEVEMIEGDVTHALADWDRALASDPTQVEELLGLPGPATPASQLPPKLVARLNASGERLADAGSTQAGRLAQAFISAQEGHAVSPSSLRRDSPRKQAASCDSATVKRWLAEERLSQVAECSGNRAGLRLSGEEQLQVARAQYMHGEPRRALQTLEALPLNSPDLSGVLYWKARCYKDLAVATFARLLQTAPDSYRAHELLGNVDAARDRDAEAIQEYQKALAENPSLPNLHYEIGHMLWKVFKVSEARKEFDAELTLNPRHVGALLDMGATYLYDHHPETALRYLNRAESLDPANNNVHEFAGMAYLQLGKYTQAESELRRAAGSDRDGRVHYQLARVYQALGEKKEAAKEFAIASQLKLESSRKNQVRTQMLNAATASLKPR